MTRATLLFPRIKPGTRPRPIRWMIPEAAADRIVVNVIDHRAKRGRFLDVAILSAASLPKTIVDLPIGLGVPQTFQKRRCLASKLPSSPLHRAFLAASKPAGFRRFWQ